jgi:hypothetical protein
MTAPDQPTQYGGSIPAPSKAWLARQLPEALGPQEMWRVGETEFVTGIATGAPPDETRDLFSGIVQRVYRREDA